MIRLANTTTLKFLAILALGTGILLAANLIHIRSAPVPALAALFERSAEFDFDPPAAGSYNLPPLKSVPEGTVLTDLGDPAKLSQLLGGKISLVSFVYLLCSDVNGCPLAMSTLFSIYDRSAAAPQLREDVQLVMISFDPERDTPEAVGAFSYPMRNDPDGHRKLDWQVLTTTGQADLKPILKGFGQAVNPSADGETLNHLLRMFLVDRAGRVRNVYGLGMIDPRLIMTDVETLLMEERQNLTGS